LLVQGTTMSGLMRRLGIVARDRAQQDYEMRHARMAALRSAETHLDRLHRDGLLSTHAWEILKPDLAGRIDTLTSAVSDSLRANPALEAEELDTARRELLRVQRTALLDLRRDGFISDEIFEHLTAEVDAELASAKPEVAPALAAPVLPDGGENVAGEQESTRLEEATPLPDSPSQGGRGAA
jgi:CPA1 family monovalent cation:H+ antiporter